VFRLDLLLSKRTLTDASVPPVPAWLAAAPPDTLTPPWQNHLPGRYAEMADRITTLVEVASKEPASWLTSIGGGAHGAEAIRQTVAYRAVYAVTGDDPLGPKPDRQGRQHDAWIAARRAIAASHNTSHREGGSGAARMLAALDHESTTNADDPASRTRMGPTRHL
jgi:hypothetical protein